MIARAVHSGARSRRYTFDVPKKMKSIALRLIAFVTLMFPVVAHAATPAQFDAWKAGFPVAASTDSAKLKQMIAGYQQLVQRITPARAKKTLLLLRDKLARDQNSANNLLHPPKPNPRITAAMGAEAEEISRWLNGKFAPFLASVPQ